MTDMTAIQYAEIVYYITGGPILALIAGLGLLQIYLAKKSIRINSRRDAYRLSSEQIKFYLTEIIPRQNDLDKKIKEEGAQDLKDKASVEMTESGLRVKRKLSEGDKEKLIACAREYLEVMNRMESFAFPFATGLAAEEEAYNSVGNTYINAMDEMLPFTITVGDRNLRHAKSLYVIWYRRQERERLYNEHKSIKEKMGNAKIGKTVKIIGES